MAMKRWLMIWFVGLTPLCQGCVTFANTARTLIVQPVLFSDEWDRFVSCFKHRCMARDALKSYVAQAGEPCSSDFGEGFLDGYTRYLNKGGTGIPRPVPPRCYWRLPYRTAEGRQAVEEYFAGYRAGAAAAIASGFRHVDTIASSLPPRPPRGWSNGSATIEPSPPVAPEGDLPVPRQLPPVPESDGVSTP
jgi:hypothetical protein